MTNTTKQTEHSFSIIQDGIEVAAGWGPLDDVRREAYHYASQYSEDGPLKVFIDGEEQ